jgi:adenylate cyclase
MNQATDPPARARLRLVGPFRLIGADRTAIELPSRRGRALLAYLALAPDRSASRERLCGLLWSDRGEPQARASLRQCLVEIRAALAASDLDILDVGREAVALRHDMIEVDAAVIEASLDAGLGVLGHLTALGPHRLLDDLSIGGLFGEWRDHARQRFDDSVAAAVRSEIAARVAKNDWASVRAAAEAFLRRDPLDETVAAAAIRADMALGETAAAHRRYRALEAGLARELGVAPGSAAREALAAPGPRAAAAAPHDPRAGGDRDDAAPLERPSIAVMPFKNLGAPDQEYFSDGISEDILTDLSKVSSLLVAARNTSFTFKGRSGDLQHVGREMGVSHILEGSVRKAGDRVRITAQLVDVAGGRQIWAERWDRTLTDIFGLQDEISSAVVSALRLRLLPHEKSAASPRGTSNSDAYNLYLMARRHRASGNEGNPGREQEIVRLCRLATEIDGSYAHAWSLMALSQSVLHFHYRISDDDGFAAAERALALNPELADAHAVKARHLANLGADEEAKAELEIALRLDPDCWEANKQAGLSSFRQKRYDDAARHYARAAAAAENDYSAAMMLMTSHTARSDTGGANRAAEMTRSRAERRVAEDGSNGSAMAAACVALAYLGRAEEARDWARRALVIDPRNLVMRYNLACALSAHLKDVDGALDILDVFFSKGDGFWLAHAKVDPDLEPLRADPRFQAMIEKTQARLAKGGRGEAGGRAAG